MELKWIFFDIGWTLIDETQAHEVRLLELREWLCSIGMGLDLGELVMKCENAASAFAKSPYIGMLASLNLTDKQLFTARHAFAYAKPNERVYEGVPELLNGLQKRYRLGVIANQSAGTEVRLREWGIRDYFALVFASAELGLSKPDPKIFREALGAANCSPAEALMVGDRLDNDIGPAKQQGWNTARVLQGFSRFQQPRTHLETPDATLQEITELPSIL